MKQGRKWSELRQERCPKCHALLFEADAEGIIEIKCRKCGYIVRRELKRILAS